MFENHIKSLILCTIQNLNFGARMYIIMLTFLARKFKYLSKEKLKFRRENTNVWTLEKDIFGAKNQIRLFSDFYLLCIAESADVAPLRILL